MRRPGGIWRACAGVAAVEFALLMPVMVVMFIGAFEVTNALLAGRKLAQVAGAAGDLTARVRSLDAAGMDDVFAAAAAVLVPLDTGPLEVTITALAESDGAMEVVWSDRWSGGVRGIGRTPGESVPAAVRPSLPVPPGGMIIMTEAAYGYRSPVGGVLAGPIAMNNVFYTLPRHGGGIGRSPS